MQAPHDVKSTKLIKTMKKFLIALNCAQKPNRGQAFESDLQKYNELIREPWLAELVSRIQDGKESLKDELPIRCSHYYRFKNNHRAQADMDPESFLFQTCVDIDDARIVESTIKKVRELNAQEGLWKDMLLHLEYSARKKLHIARLSGWLTTAAASLLSASS